MPWEYAASVAAAPKVRAPTPPYALLIFHQAVVPTFLTKVRMMFLAAVVHVPYQIMYATTKRTIFKKKVQLPTWNQNKSIMKNREMIKMERL